MHQPNVNKNNENNDIAEFYNAVPCDDLDIERIVSIDVG